MYNNKFDFPNTGVLQANADVIKQLSMVNIIKLIADTRNVSNPFLLFLPYFE